MEKYDERPLAERPVVDYTDAYNRSYGADAEVVHAVGREMLVFFRLERPRPLTIHDRAGRRRKITATHAIDSLTLSEDARDGRDDYAGVLYGPDTEYLTASQAARVRRATSKAGTLFAAVRVFP